MLVSALAALLLYIPGLGGGFVWDDHLLIEQNPLLRSPAGISRALGADFWAASGGANSSGIWRPLITLSYALDGALGHWHAGWFHVANAIAHAGASALVAALALGTGASPLLAGLAGILFAALPAHAESVAWISGRTDVYCALFLLLALVLDRRARAAGRRWPGPWPLLALALALLAKETALAFLPVAAVAEWIGVRGRRADLRSSAIWLAPYAALSALHLLVHQAWVRAPGANAVLVPAREGLEAVALMFPGYLAFAWPWFAHTPAVTLEPTRASVALVAGAIALQLAFLAALVDLLRRRVAAALPLALFWLATLPTLIVDLSHGYYLYAERFFYLPSAGLAWAAAVGVESLRDSRRLRIIGIAALVGLAAASAFALERVLPDWRDDMALFGSMVRHAPRNYMARTQWARQLALAGRDAEAARQLDAAQAIDPTRPEAPSVRAYLAYRHGDWSGALAAADRAIERGDTDLEPRLLRVASLFSLGRVEEGRATLEALRRRTPGQPAVESLWGQYLLEYGRRGEAYPVLARVARLLPEDADVAYKLGLAAADAGRGAEARAAFERAVALDATRYDAWLELARVRADLGDRAGAEAALARAQALPGAADGRAAALRARLDATR
ncbi:MAG TPA: tetratricopeptide repeat protein [Terriglobales bacterium]|nr:tetratricopeptide repeat protein [Terriglobales bacterium]